MGSKYFRLIYSKINYGINRDKNILKINQIARKRVKDLYPIEKMINKYKNL